jgi:hypothetical protein
MYALWSPRESNDLPHLMLLNRQPAHNVAILKEAKVEQGERALVEMWSWVDCT